MKVSFRRPASLLGACSYLWIILIVLLISSMIHWCLGSGLSRRGGGEGRSYHHNASFHSECPRGLHRTKWHPQVSRLSFYACLLINLYSSVLIWKEQSSMRGKKNPPFFLNSIRKVKKGTLLIDSSTIDPAVSKEMAVAAEKMGAVFMDAPVTGGRDCG